MIEKLQGPVKMKSSPYDQAWVELIKDAKRSGLTIAEIRVFLQKGNSYTSIKSSSQKSKLQHF